MTEAGRKDLVRKIRDEIIESLIAKLAWPGRANQTHWRGRGRDFLKSNSTKNRITRILNKHV